MLSPVLPSKQGLPSSAIAPGCPCPSTLLQDRPGRDVGVGGNATARSVMRFPGLLGGLSVRERFDGPLKPDLLSKISS